MIVNRWMKSFIYSFRIYIFPNFDVVHRIISPKIEKYFFRLIFKTSGKFSVSLFRSFYTWSKFYSIYSFSKEIFFFDMVAWLYVWLFDCMVLYGCDLVPCAGHVWFINCLLTFRKEGCCWVRGVECLCVWVCGWGVCVTPLAKNLCGGICWPMDQKIKYISGLSSNRFIMGKILPIFLSTTPHFILFLHIFKTGIVLNSIYLSSMGERLFLSAPLSFLPPPPPLKLP